MILCQDLRSRALLLFLLLRYNTIAQSLSFSRREALFFTAFPFSSDKSTNQVTWTGTHLSHLSLSSALAQLEDGNLNIFPMARWPDPILRIKASPIPPAHFQTSALRNLASALRRTSRQEKAVGLSAQQCGIDASLIFLENGTPSGLFVFNPRIVRRSPEMSMRVWTEHCLVLPPTFEATVLRDENIVVEAENYMGETKSIEMRGELARAVQHEMDHDRGILITDLVGQEEMEGMMWEVEREGHDERQSLAYARSVVTPSVQHSKGKMLLA